MYKDFIASLFFTTLCILNYFHIKALIEEDKAKKKSLN